MKKITSILIFLLAFSLSTHAQENVTVEKDQDGWKLLIDGEPFMVNGMNWDYFPRGTNYSYSLWNQPPEFIKNALDYEMGLLQNMGVNVIRVYSGMPIGQLIYFKVEGKVEVDYSSKDSAKYNQRTPRPVESMMWKNSF